MSCSSDSSDAGNSPEDCCDGGGVVGRCSVLLLLPELSRSRMCC